jgi:hypothetical protein
MEAGVAGAVLPTGGSIFIMWNTDGGPHMTFLRISYRSVVPAIRLCTATPAREVLASPSSSLKRFCFSSLLTPARRVLRYGVERSASGFFAVYASTARLGTSADGHVGRYDEQV